MKDILLNTLEKTRKLKKYRKGRGISQGRGKTSGRGQKGQKSRSGGHVRVGFEGGQTPLYRRIPKRGFTNINRKKRIIFNLDFISKHFQENDVVDFKKLLQKGLVRKKDEGNIKILGKGKLKKNIIIKINLMSSSAAKIIKTKEK